MKSVVKKFQKEKKKKKDKQTKSQRIHFCVALQDGHDEENDRRGKYEEKSCRSWDKRNKMDESFSKPWGFDAKTRK